MAPTIISSKLTLKYPLFCADFFEPPTDSDEPVTVAVAGGGGEGRSGVGNRITIIDVSNSTEARTLTEAELSKEEDSPMSLCTLTEGGIIAGINAGEKVIAESNGSGNQHFRVFRQLQDVNDDDDDEKPILKEISKKPIFSPSVLQEADMYQRLCRSKRGHVVVVGSGGGKKAENEIVALRKGGNDWLVADRIRPEDGKEAVDLDVDLEDEELTVGWCLPQGVYTYSSSSTYSTKNSPMESPDPIFTLTPNSGVFRSFRFITHNGYAGKRLIATIVNLPTRSGAHLLILSSPSTTSQSSTLLSRRPLHRNIRAATSLDLISLPPTTNSRGQLQGQSILAVSGADMSVEILVLDYPLHGTTPVQNDIRVRTLKTYYNVHPFQITKVAWSQPVKNPTGSYELKLVTVSMGQTVVTYTVPLITVSRNPSTAEGNSGSSTAALFNPSSPPTPSNEKVKGSKKKRGGSSGGILDSPIVPLTQLSTSTSSTGQPSSIAPSHHSSRGMYVLPPPGTRRATLYSVTVSLGLVVFLAILLQLVFVYRGGLLVAGPMGVDALSQMEYPHDEGRIIDVDEEKIVEAVREAAEVAGEWMVEEGRKVAGGVVKGMVRGAVEQGVRGVLGA